MHASPVYSLQGAQQRKLECVGRSEFPTLAMVSSRSVFLFKSSSIVIEFVCRALFASQLLCATESSVRYVYPVAAILCPPQYSVSLCGYIKLYGTTLHGINQQFVVRSRNTSVK